MTPPTAPVPAPTGAMNVARQLGPGLIITACILGSGELVTPKLGASAGFSLLWFIVLGCLMKVFVQIELGRQVVVHGQTTLSVFQTDLALGPSLAFTVCLLVSALASAAAGLYQVAQQVGGLLP